MTSKCSCCPCVCCGCLRDIYVSRRYIMVMGTFAGMLIAHAMRVNMAVTVVTILDAEPHTKVGSISAIESLPQVDWSSFMVGFLHAIFYMGYITTQIPGGYLCQVLPSHRLFGGCILISSTLNLLLPVAIAHVGFEFTCVIRVLQGISEGVLYPSAYSILRHWTTPEERSRMGAITLTGVYLGPVIGLILSGYLAHIYGWMYVFYVHGGAGIIWSIVWFMLSYETPATHSKISKDELNYITEKQGQTAVIYEHDRVPWKSILFSLPVLALNVCNFGRNFVFFFLLTNEPTFLNVFGYNLAENGVLSALPHALMAVIAALSGPIADVLIADTLLSRTQVRKLFTCLGFGTEAACLYCLGVLTDGTSALIFLTIGVGISGFTVSGWQINHLDLAPRYASILVGITTTVGTLAGIINPVIVGWMTSDQTIEEWHNVFIMTASVLVFTVVFYLFFGSGEKQPWAEPSPHPENVIHPNMKSLIYGTFQTQLSNNEEKSQKFNISENKAPTTSNNSIVDTKKDSTCVDSDVNKRSFDAGNTNIKNRSKKEVKESNTQVETSTGASDNTRKNENFSS